MVTTTRLTVGQALVRFLAAQRTERDGVEHRLIEGYFGIFGHGNVAGVGQALLQEQRMVLTEEVLSLAFTPIDAVAVARVGADAPGPGGI